MEDVHDLGEFSILSHSYIQGVKRVANNRNEISHGFEIDAKVLEAREKKWQELFEKYSKVSDDVELNILTLMPDGDTSGSYTSEYRVPVRKSAAQIQYWVNTGNPPCRAVEAESTDTDETVSISESEATDFDDSQASPSASMMVQNKLGNSGEKSITSGSSASSVDTAAYILRNTNSRRKSNALSIEKDPRTTGFVNLDNNRVGRSIKATIPKVFLSRSMELPKNSQVFEGTSVLGKSMSGDLESERNHEPILTRAAKKALDSSISDKNNEVLTASSKLVGKQLKNKYAKDCEVTLESKESGVGSSLVTESVGKRKLNEEQMNSSSSGEIMLVSRKSLLHPRRKLYTGNNCIFDLVSPTIKTNNISRSLKSVHPALDSPFMNVVQPKRKFRPRFLTMPGVSGRVRKSKNYSLNESCGRGRQSSMNKSTISKRKLIRKSVKSHMAKLGDIPLPTISEQISISNADNNHNNSVDVRVDVGEDKADGNDQVEPLEQLKRIKTSKSRVGVFSSSSSVDDAQIVNEDLNAVSEMPFVRKRRKGRGRYRTADIRSSKSRDSENDDAEIFKPVIKSSSKRNLYATEFSEYDPDTISNVSNILLPNLKKQTLRSKTMTASIESLKNSVQKNPVVVLHNFLQLKDCCGKLEKENNKYWLQKLAAKKIESSSHSEQAIAARDTRITHRFRGSRGNGENLKLAKAVSPKVSPRKKQRLQRKRASRKYDVKIVFTTKFDFDTDDSCSSKGRRSSRLNVNKSQDLSRSVAAASISSQQVGLEESSLIGGNITVTFKKTNHDRMESRFLPTSSESEDDFKKFLENSKLKSSKNEVGKTRGTGDCAKAQFRIVSSSSEDEGNTI